MFDPFTIVIFLLGITAYTTAVAQMITGQYTPSFFSRGVWFLLGIISFAGVYYGEGSTGAVILAGTLLAGNTAVFITSYKKGSRTFGAVEQISLSLLVVSCAVWAIFDSPFISLVVSLFAHFVGGIPTIWRVFKQPETERAYHWYFYFVACIITLVTTDNAGIKATLFPLYFAFFDGLIIIFANRNRLLRVAK